MTPARLPARTPARTLVAVETCATYRPSTKTTRGPAPRATRSTSADAGSGERGPWASVNAVPAIGATLVNRHSSCFVVGKPNSTNRAIARSRISFSHDGADPAPLLENVLKSARYR